MELIQPPSKIEYRELTPDEVASLIPIFQGQDAVFPRPEYSRFVGAVEGGKVIGFIVLQIQLHAEPMWIEEGRASIFKGLITEAEKTILRTSGPQLVYVFAPAGRVSQMATSMGMQLEPWVVLSKLVVNEGVIQ